MAAVLLTGCDSSADADRARASITEAVAELPDVADVSGTVDASNGGGLETYHSAQVTIEMDDGAPAESFTRVATAATQATDGGEPGSLWVKDAAGGSVRFDTDAPGEMIDATVAAWRDWSAGADAVEPGSAPVEFAQVELVATRAREHRPATSDLDVAFVYARPLTPTDVVSLVGAFQAELPKPLASIETSLVLTDTERDSGGVHFTSTALPVPPSVLETIASVEGTTAVLGPLGGSVNSIDWYGEDPRGRTDNPEQLVLEVGFPGETSLPGTPLDELQATPQWAAYQQVTTLANPSETVISFRLSANDRPIAGFSAHPCGSADDDPGAEGRTNEADDAIAAWWLAQAPACPGVGRHE